MRLRVPRRRPGCHVHDELGTLSEVAGPAGVFRHGHSLPRSRGRRGQPVQTDALPRALLNGPTPVAHAVEPRPGVPGSEAAAPTRPGPAPENGLYVAYARYIERRWPLALKDAGAWPLIGLRQAFLNGSLTRLLDVDGVLKGEIVEFVTKGDFRLASGQQPGGGYGRVWYKELISPDEVASSR